MILSDLGATRILLRRGTGLQEMMKGGKIDQQIRTQKPQSSFFSGRSISLKGVFLVCEEGGGGVISQRGEKRGAEKKNKLGELDSSGEGEGNKKIHQRGGLPSFKKTFPKSRE